MLELEVVEVLQGPGLHVATVTVLAGDQVPLQDEPDELGGRRLDLDLDLDLRGGGGRGGDGEHLHHAQVGGGMTQ